MPASSAAWIVAMLASSLAPPYDRLALLDEGRGGLAVVLGQAGVEVVGGLDVQALPQAGHLGAVEVLLHVAVGEPRAGGQPPRALHDLGLELLVVEDRVD